MDGLGSVLGCASASCRARAGLGESEVWRFEVLESEYREGSRRWREEGERRGSQTQPREFTFALHACYLRKRRVWDDRAYSKTRT